MINRMLENIGAKTLIIVGYILFFVIIGGIFSIIGTKKSVKTLNVCVFTETFCPEAITRFEKTTGVKVNVTYAELDEHIFAKFKIDEGNGYDVINVSDFMVQMLVKQGDLQSIDYSKLKNINKLNKFLLGLPYDPSNEHAVPHKWFLYGIVYDTQFFKNVDEVGLELLFKDPSDVCDSGLADLPYRACVLDGPQDLFFFAAMYLFGRYTDLDNTALEQIKKLLIDQKKWVECYTTYSIEYFLLSGIVPIALTSSNFMRKLLDVTDRFKFVIPKEGGMLVVENLAIPKHCSKRDLAHQFIDFMISDEIAALNSSTYKWSSANKFANESLDRTYQDRLHLYLQRSMLDRLYTPLYSPSMRTAIEDMWLEVGFA